MYFRAVRRVGTVCAGTSINSHRGDDTYALQKKQPMYSTSVAFADLEVTEPIADDTS